MGRRLDGYVQTHSYEYRNARGALIFYKHRWELVDPLTLDANGKPLRRKEFSYYCPGTGEARKPVGADGLLYRLPEILAGVDSGATVHWLEGEKDADAAAACGLVATTHHQGAGNATFAQADSIRQATRVRLWVDKDDKHPEVGAYDAWRRYELLIDAGMDPAAVNFWRAPGRWHGPGAVKDFADMIAAGYTVKDAVYVDKDKLRFVAERFTPGSGARLGYDAWAERARRAEARKEARRA